MRFNLSVKTIDEEKKKLNKMNVKENEKLNTNNYTKLINLY